jgi:flagellar hook-associated protein FlgK
MDDLSSGASVLAVVTNAVQLADNIKAFKQSLEKIKTTLLLA